MSKQLTPEDLEKMSPQSLIEFMTENIPAEKLRACLQKVEEFPSELPSQVMAAESELPPAPLPPPPGLPEVSQIDVLRNKCEKYPVIISKIDKVKGKEGDYVYFYKKKDGKYKLVATQVEKFDSENCSDETEVTDVDCEEIADWIQSKTKDGVLDKTIKAVMIDYVKRNSADFITKCDNVKELLGGLGIEVPESEEEPVLEEGEDFVKMSNADKLKFLQNSCVYKAGILIGDLVKTDDSKAVVYIPQPAGDGTYIWKRFRLKLDDLNTKWCEKLQRKPVDSEDYRKYSLAYLNSSEDTKKEIGIVVNNLKKMGVQIPYSFLEGGGSSFGSTTTDGRFPGVDSRPEQCHTDVNIALGYDTNDGYSAMGNLSPYTYNESEARYHNRKIEK